MPNKKKKRRPAAVVKAIHENRLKRLADRLAILLVVCNARDEDDWNPWALDRTYDDEDSMGDHMRRMKDYKVAKGIVRRWLEKSDEETLKEFE